MMSISNEKVSRLEKLCFSSIESGIRRLCTKGVWPRPPASRRLRPGYDFRYEDLENVKEIQELTQYLASDKKLGKIYFGTATEPREFLYYELWELLFVKILRDTDGNKINKAVFKKWYRKFIKELYSETAILKSIDTIVGLEVLAKTIQLDSKTIVTSTPGYDLKTLLSTQKMDLYDFHGKLPGGTDKATIISTTKIPKHQYNVTSSPPLMEHIRRSVAFIDAVRLIKSGVPQLNCTIIIHHSSFPLFSPFSYSGSGGFLGLYEKEAILERRDFKPVKDIWQELMTKYRDDRRKKFPVGRMEIALNRFSASYQLQSWYEKIVDLTIALESLFSPTDTTQELAYRIRMRAAWLLGVDKEEEEKSSKIYDRVKTMYDIRSSVVHGGLLDENTVKKWLNDLLDNSTGDTQHLERMLEPAVESARSIVRRAIIACRKLSNLEPSGPFWPFPPNFDKIMADDRSRRLWQQAAGVIKRRR